MYTNVPTIDPSTIKRLRFKLRHNEFLQDDKQPLPHRYLLVPDGNIPFAQLCRKATHAMNMPVYHTYSKGKYFIGFRCPHYVIEDVSWKREMKGKGMSTVASPRAASSSGGSPSSISPSSAVSNNGSGSGSSLSTTGGSSYSLMTVSEDGLESEYGDEADAEYEEGEEDENDEYDEDEDTDYAPSESTGFTGNRKVSDYVLRAGKQ